MGLQLKKIRKRKGLSQEALAERAETSPNYLSRMERREMLKGFVTEVKDEEKLQIAVRVLRSIAR
jgi:transcriptional regulator with XRE-family HTH domain